MILVKVSRSTIDTAITAGAESPPDAHAPEAPAARWPSSHRWIGVSDARAQCSMPTGKDPAAPAGFAVADRVRAARDIGAFRPRVPRGTVGMVMGFSPAGELEVEFANGRVELLAPDALLPDP